MRTPGWPAVLAHQQVTLRPLRRGDRRDWTAVRRENEAWLRPWEATVPDAPELTWAERNGRLAYRELMRRQRSQARAGTHFPFGVFHDGRLCGQMNVGEVVRGAFESAFVGYWVDRRLAGRGIAPLALAMVADHCFARLGLHRLEANVRPENAASLRVVAKVGFAPEGLRRRYLSIDGDWRDHLGFALLAEDFPGGVLTALLGDRTSG